MSLEPTDGAPSTFDAASGGAPVASDESPYVGDELGGAGDSAQPATTIMDELEAELGAQLDITTCTLPVPGRPKYAVVYRTNLQGPEIERARTQATVRAARAGREAVLDGSKYAALICATACEQVLRNSGSGFEPLLDDRQRPWRFNHQALMRLVKASSASECVRKFYGRDASVDAAANKVLVDSGWGTELEDIDVEDELVPDPSAAGSAG